MAARSRNQTAIGQIYNISGEKAVTLLMGWLKPVPWQPGKIPESLKIVHYNPKDFDFGKKKAFPMRVQHFFASIEKAKAELNWKPSFDLVSGLKDLFPERLSRFWARQSRRGL